MIRASLPWWKHGAPGVLMERRRGAGSRREAEAGQEGRCDPGREC
jgi:hypothetical protein